MDNYFNTTNLAGQDLYAKVRQTKSQNELVLEFFKQNPTSLYTPFDVQDAVWPPGRVLKQPPITSVRRALTSLTKAGKLVKTNVRITGAEGEKNYCWTLATIKK